MKQQEHIQLDAETRKLRFEARKFALETLTKVYLSQAEEARLYLLGYLRLTFALAVGALAGFLTLIGAFARFAEHLPLWPRDRVELTLLGVGLVLMVLASLVALAQSRSAVKRKMKFLSSPFSGSEAAINSILSDDPDDERVFLDQLSHILSAQAEAGWLHVPSMLLVQVLVVSGVVIGGAGFMML